MEIKIVKQNCKNTNKSKNYYVQVEFKSIGAPKGIRIPVSSLKGWCPRPLDDGGTVLMDRGVKLPTRLSQGSQTLYSYPE